MSEMGRRAITYFFFRGEDGIHVLVGSRGLEDGYEDRVHTETARGDAVSHGVIRPADNVRGDAAGSAAGYAEDPREEGQWGVSPRPIVRASQHDCPLYTFYAVDQPHSVALRCGRIVKTKQQPLLPL